MEDKDAAEVDREHCVDCKAIAPDTNTNYTLISPRHGWRLTRLTTPTGRKVSEWRCPDCFAKIRLRPKT